MRFVIFAHVLHRERNGRYFAYPPYVREMNLWFRNVQEVEVVAPLLAPPVPLKKGGELREGMCYEFEGKVEFTEVPSFDLLTWKSRLESLVKIPLIFFRIMGAMRGGDHLHLRCPGNVGLLACLAQIFFPKKPKTAKYAGNWDPKAKQPWTYKLQRWILRNTFLTRNMTVLVYGDWSGKTKNTKPFFTASFSEKENLTVDAKKFEAPFLFLFVGNLVPGKHPLKAIQLVQRLRKNGCVVQLEIYGDGPERQLLEAYCREEDLEDLVQLKGSRSLGELKEAYQKAHFLILASDSEGWPKAVAEAMFFGVIPISSAVSCVPWMLEQGSRGVLLNSTDTGEIEGREWLEKNSRKMAQLMKDEQKMQNMSTAAKEWSQQYTLEKFEREIKKLLN